MSAIDLYENTIKGMMRAPGLGKHILHITCGIMVLLLASVGFSPADAQRRSVLSTGERNADYDRSGLLLGQTRGEVFYRSRIKRTRSVTIRLNHPTTSGAAKNIKPLELSEEDN